MTVRRFNARPNTDYSTASPLAFDSSSPGGRELKFYLCDTFVELPVSMNTGDQAYVISNNTFWIATSSTVWGAIGPSVGSALTIQEEDGAPLDAAVTKIRVPNTSLIINAVGDISLNYELAGAVTTHVALADPHPVYSTNADLNTGDVLIGTVNTLFTNAIVVGVTPGGELGGTWANPTVDAVHSGSAHHAVSHNILSVDHVDTLVDTVVRGDLMIGNLTPKWARLAKGAAGSVLWGNGTDTAWTINPNIAGYTRIGSAVAPANIVTGDLTSIRLNVGNVAFNNTFDIARFTSPSVDPGVAGVQAFLFEATWAPINSASTIVNMNITNSISPTANSATGIQGLRVNLTHAAGAFNLTDIGNQSTSFAVINASFNKNVAGTISAFIGIRSIFSGIAAGRISNLSMFQSQWLSGAGGTLGTLNHYEVVTISPTTVVDFERGLHIPNLGSANKGQVFAIDIDIQSGANLINFGIRNFSNSQQQGYAHFGVANVPINITDGDLTCIRLKVGNAAFASGAEAHITGDTVITGFLGLGSATAPASTAAGDITTPGKHVWTPQAQQSIAISAAIVVTGTEIQVSTQTAADMTATPTIANGVDGQLITIINTGANTFKLQDQGTLANSNLRLLENKVELSTRKTITLMYSTSVGGWIQIQTPVGFDFLGSIVLTGAAVTTGALTIAARDELMILVRVTSYSGGGDIASFRFNADSGANYWSRYLSAAAGVATLTNNVNVSAALARIFAVSSTLSRTALVKINNRLGTSKVGAVAGQTGSGAAGTSAGLEFGGFEWVNTAAQITSIEMRTAGGAVTFGIGTGFQVFGRNYQ